MLRGTFWLKIWKLRCARARELQMNWKSALRPGGWPVPRRKMRRGLNADFQFIWSSRACAQRNFQILNQLLVTVALNINEHSTDEGHSPETSGHLLRFWHFHTILNFYKPKLSHKKPWGGTDSMRPLPQLIPSSSPRRITMGTDFHWRDQSADSPTGTIVTLGDEKKYWSSIFSWIPITWIF